MAVLGALKPFGSLSPFGGLGGSAPAPHQPATLREAVYWLLSRDPAVKALVGDRVHPDGLPQPAAHPAVVTQVVGGFDARDYDGLAHSTSRLRVACWAATPEDVDALAGAVKSLLTDYSGLVGSVQIADCWRVNEVDLPVAPGGGSAARPRQTVLDFQVQSF